MTQNEIDEKVRVAFEAYAKRKNWPINRIGDGYRSKFTQEAFENFYAGYMTLWIERKKSEQNTQQ